MDRAEYVFYKLAEGKDSKSTKLTSTNADPSALPTYGQAISNVDLNKNTWGGISYKDPDKLSNNNYLGSRAIPISVTGGNKLTSLDLWGSNSNKTNPLFSSEWQGVGSVDIPSLSKQVMNIWNESDKTGYPVYSSVGAGWKDQKKAYDLAREHNTTYYPPIIYGVKGKKDPYLGYGAFNRPPVVENTPYKEYTTRVNTNTTPYPLNYNINYMNEVTKVPRVEGKDEQGFVFPYLGALGAFTFGNMVNNSGKGLGNSGDLSTFGRMFQYPGEGFKPGNTKRPYSTGFGGITGFLTGMGLNYVPRLFGAPYTVDDFIQQNINSGAKWVGNQISTGVNWLGKKLGLSGD